MARHARHIMVLALGALGVASNGWAQQGSLASTARATLPVARKGGLIIAPAVVITTTPPSFETIEIRRPSELPRGGDVTFVVVPSGGMRILGRLSGVLSPGTESLLLTVAVPATVLAGTVEAARVRFSTPLSPPVEVPIHLTVAPTTVIELIVPGGRQRVVRGGRLVVEYSVVNGGNRDEDVAVNVVTPPGWIALPPGETIALKVKQVAERRVEIVVPNDATTGSATVHLIASVGGGPVARASIGFQVLASAQRAFPGPQLTAGLMFADGPEGITPSLSAAIDGSVSPGLRVTGHVSNASLTSTNPAVYRLGAWAQPSFVAIDAGAWSVAAGHRGHQFGTLTGSSVSGNGVQGGVVAGRWTVSTLHARPGWGAVKYDGELSGATAQYDAGGVILQASGSHLREEGSTERQLDALGIGAIVPSIAQGRLAADIAHRRYAAGSGQGYGLEYARQTPTDQLLVRVIHAPGGRDAFAQASEQVNAGIGRRLGSRVGVFADHWRSSDGGARSSLRTWGSSASARVGLTRQLMAGIGVRQSAFAAGGIGGEMRAGENAVEATADFHAGAFAVNVRTAFGDEHRETSSPTGSPLVEAGRRASLDGSLGVRTGGGGTVGVTARYDRRDATVGALPQRGDFTVRADRIPMIGGRTWQLRVDAEVRKSVVPGLETGVTTAAALALQLPGGMTVAWAAERNPFFHAGPRGTSWTHALRLERRTILPMVVSPATRGVVFRDVNGNGRRDAAEEGVAGVVVRQQDVTGVSDVDGLFTIAGSRAGIVSVDPTTLDAGWIAGRSTTVGGRHDIAIVPLAPVTVKLRLEDPQGLGIERDSLRTVAVLARHESGRLWVARRTGVDSASFDALPPGRYTVQLDVSSLGVPVVVVGEMPAFDVISGLKPATLIVTLRRRQLQIRQLPPPRS